MPVPPTPNGLGWFASSARRHRPRRAIGSGEFLLGPAVFVRYGLSLLWVTASRRCCRPSSTRRSCATRSRPASRSSPASCGRVPSSTLWAWFYVDALLSAVRLACVCRDRRRRRLLSVPRGGSRPRATAATIYYIGVGDVPRLRRGAVVRAADRAHARDPQLGARCLHPGRLPVAGRALRAVGDLARGRGRARRVRPAIAAACSCSRPVRTSFCSARSWRIRAREAWSTSSCATGRATKATA